MRIGILPGVPGGDYDYSSGCRAKALVRRLSYCELFKEGEQYDAVLVQKYFNPKVCERLLAERMKLVVDVCDYKCPYPPSWLQCMQFADTFTVPTADMKAVINQLWPGKPVYVTYDIKEYDMNWTMPTYEYGCRQLIVPGTYYNVIKLIDCIEQVSKVVTRVVVLTDVSHQKQARDVFRNVSLPVDVRPWVWERLPQTFTGSAVALLLYGGKPGYKSCNRSLLAMHMGLPVVSVRQPQLCLLQLDGLEHIFMYKGNIQLPSALDAAFNRADYLSVRREQRYNMRVAAYDSRFGVRAATESWHNAFQRMIKHA